MSAVATNVKAKHLPGVLRQVEAALVEDERVTHVYKGAGKLGLVAELVDLLVISDLRVLALLDGAVEFEAHAGKVGVSGDGTWFGWLEIAAGEGKRVEFRGLDKHEFMKAREAIAWLSVRPPVANGALEARAAQQEAWSDVLVVGGTPKVNGATLTALQQISPHGGPPRLIITGGSAAGVLAAFDDFCVIVKAGAMTGLMSGALGGGRQATFHYSEITGVEYNSGLLSGVLEILTASCQGTATKDFWRGTTAGRNADSNDPYTLSNTLPLFKQGHAQAQAQVQELRRLTAEAKQVRVVVPARPAAPSSAEELSKLAELRDQGVLDDAEFADAKRAVLNRPAREARDGAAGARSGTSSWA